MRIVLVKIAKNREDKCLIRSGLTDVAESVSEGLELGAVFRDRQIPLDGVTELSFELDSPTFLVVTKQVFDGRPDFMSRCAGLHDYVHDFHGDRTIHLGENDIVTDTVIPIGVVGVVRRANAFIMSLERIFAEGDEKNFTSLRIVRS